MCGLVGVAGYIDGAYNKVFKQLLIIDSIRGEHSTGILAVHTNGATNVHKQVGSPFELFDSKALDETMKYTCNLLMGHNRYATTGDVVKKNAHPFECGGLIGAHNGTLRNKYLLKDSADYTVDSENLYHHMDEHGVADTLKIVNGAFALSWYDIDEETINFIRNDERPLHGTFSLDMKTLIWASEPWMLTSILEKNNLKHREVFEFTKGMHYRLPIENCVRKDFKPFDAFIIDDIPLYHVATNCTNINKNKSKGASSVRQNSSSCTQLPNKSESTGRGISNTSPDKLVKSYFELVNKSVSFRVTGWSPLIGAQQPHITGVLEDDSSVEFKIFAEFGSDLWHDLLENGGFFSGRVKRISNFNGFSGVIDKNSIVEVVESDIDEWTEEDYDNLMGTGKKFLVGLMPRTVSHSDYKSLTAAGCSWCSDIPRDGEEDTIIWFSEDEFVCDHCANDKDIKRYLHL